MKEPPGNADHRKTGYAGTFVVLFFFSPHFPDEGEIQETLESVLT